VVKPDFIDTMEVVRSVVECIKDVNEMDDTKQVPEEYERKIKRSAIEEVSDSREFRVLVVASLFELRNSIREMNRKMLELDDRVKISEGRVSEKLKAIRGSLV